MSTAVEPGMDTVMVGSVDGSKSHTVKNPHWVSAGCSVNSEEAGFPSSR